MADKIHQVGRVFPVVDGKGRVEAYAPVALLGKIMCYAICALAMDLIWGYTGILSLGHGLFFALGGYMFLSMGDAIVKSMVPLWPAPAIASRRAA